MTRPTRLLRVDLIETHALAAKSFNKIADAVDALRQAQAGYPSGGDGTGGGDVVDLSARLDDRGNLIDDAGRELDQLSRELDQMHRLARSTYDTVERWSRPPTAAQKAKDAGQGDPGCEVCARYTTDDGHAHWSPAHVEESTVKGNLERGHRLCRFHYDFVLRQGRITTKAETLAHLAGKRVRVSA